MIMPIFTITFRALAFTLMFFLTGMFMSSSAFSSGGGQCEDNVNGTVKDNGSGLMWQKATGGPMAFCEAKFYALGLSLGGHSGWRLPTKDELKGLYNSECKKLMDVQNAWYRSSSYYSPMGINYSWMVDFSNGDVKGGGNLSSHYVRAVRSAQ